MDDPRSNIDCQNSPCPWGAYNSVQAGRLEITSKDTGKCEEVPGALGTHGRVGRSYFTRALCGGGMKWRARLSEHKVRNRTLSGIGQREVGVEKKMYEGGGKSLVLSGKYRMMRTVMENWCVRMYFPGTFIFKENFYHIIEIFLFEC